MPSIAFYTLGCKVNQQETGALRAMFVQAGYRAVEFEECADVYVINTCTVTQMSDKKSRQAIARAHARNPGAFIAVVGCYAQRAPDTIEKLPGVQLIVGTQHRDKLVEWISEARSARNAVEDIQGARSFETLPAAVQDERTRMQLKIQDGCDRYCSYCIIPYARGPVRSMPPLDIVGALTRAGEAGVGEIVLTGIHLMSYGKDLPDKTPLADIIHCAAHTKGIGRVRLGSLEPDALDDAFIAALKVLPAGKLCAQFHLSMQSGSQGVLARMNRRYTPAQYSVVVKKLRTAFVGCAITTDVIAGFPGETEQEHEETMAFIEEIGFARIHVFPYSRREGTKAALMQGQLDKAVKERRAHKLSALGEKLEEAYVRAQINTVQSVLCEKNADGYGEGYTGNYVRARIPGGQEGELVDVRITGTQGMVLNGELFIKKSIV